MNEQLPVGNIQQLSDQPAGLRQTLGSTMCVIVTEAEWNRLQAENARLREHCLDLYGTLLCVQEYLRGDLPDATPEQLLAMIADAEPEPKSGGAE